MATRLVSFLVAPCLFAALGDPGAQAATDTSQTFSLESMKVRIVVTPSVATAGSFVNVDVHVVDGALSQFEIRLSFGDGQVGRYEFIGECSSPADTIAYAAPVRFQHGYRRLGAYSLQAVVTSAGCDASGSPPLGRSTEVSVASEKVIVAGGVDVTNGPEKPQVDAGVDPAKPPRKRKPFDLQIVARDGDGVVREVALTGPNGKRQIFTRELERCDDPLVAWPTSEWAFTVPQRFDREGTYHYKTEVLSTGCDGGHAQKAISRSNVTVSS